MLKPLGEKVLIRPFAAETVPNSAFVTVARVENRVVQRGEVIARGTKLSADINDGDIVQFVADFDCAKVVQDGIQHLLVEYNSILGVEA